MTRTGRANIADADHASLGGTSLFDHLDDTKNPRRDRSARPRQVSPQRGLSEAKAQFPRRKPPPSRLAVFSLTHGKPHPTPAPPVQASFARCSERCGVENTRRFRYVRWQGQTGNPRDTASTRLPTRPSDRPSLCRHRRIDVSTGGWFWLPVFGKRQRRGLVDYYTVPNHFISLDTMTIQ